MDNLPDFTVPLLLWGVGIAAFLLLSLALARSFRAMTSGEKHIIVRNYADAVRRITDPLQIAALSKAERKQQAREERARAKEEKRTQTEPKPRIWVLDFEGDIGASAVVDLKDEITAVLQVAKPGDEVLARIHSDGGTVVGYGLGASHLDRIRNAGIRLVTGVDRSAASGGYMMACVGEHIVAAPFAIIGSIGVIATIPNVRPLLDDKGVRVLEVTAGEYKRTVTPFSEVTPERMEKLQSQLADVHQLFKDHVAERRPALNINEVATGEYWYGKRALELGLVDTVSTTDDWLIARMKTHDIYLVRTMRAGQRVGLSLERMLTNVIARVRDSAIQEPRISEIHRF